MNGKLAFRQRKRRRQMRDRSPSVETRDGDGYYYTYLISRRASVSVLIRGYSLVLFVITLVHVCIQMDRIRQAQVARRRRELHVVQGCNCRANNVHVV